MKIQKFDRVLGVAVAVAMILTVAACSKKGEEEAGAGGGIGEALEAAEDFINEQRKEAVLALQENYEAFSQEFEEFKERNAFVFTEAKRNLVTEIEEKQAQIKEQLVQARSAAEETWQEIQNDITTTMEEMKQAMVDFES